MLSGLDQENANLQFLEQELLSTKVHTDLTSYIVHKTQKALQMSAAIEENLSSALQPRSPAICYLQSD